MNYLLRFAGCMIGFSFTILVSYLSGIELFKVCALVALALVLDTITVRIVANMYMKAVYEAMEKANTKDKQ